MLIGFGGVMYKLFTLYKAWKKRRQMSATSTIQQPEIIRLDNNQRIDLHHNSQSNSPPSRNADLSAQIVSGDLKQEDITI